MLSSIASARRYADRHWITGAAAFLALLTAVAFAEDEEAFKRARSNAMYLMERGSYAQAELEFLKAAKATSQSSRAWMYKHAGDAAFLRDDLEGARKHYALGIATRFERDLWITTENRGWGQAAAGEEYERRVEIDIPRMQGTPNEVAPTPKRSIRSYEPLPVIKSGHSREFRSLVGDIGRQLKSTTRKNDTASARAMPIDAQERKIPGAGIARVLTANGTCPAVRSTRGSYIASASCLAQNGTFPAMPWTLMHETGLHAPDVCRVEDYWTQEGKNSPSHSARPPEDWAVLAVQSDCHPFFIESIPLIAVNRQVPPLGTGKTATIEYSDAYRQMVPVLRFCDASDGECTSQLNHHAAVWRQLGEATDAMRPGDWRFAGFASPGGAIVDYSIARDLVSALQKAWDVGQQRRTRAEEEERETLGR